MNDEVNQGNVPEEVTPPQAEQAAPPPPQTPPQAAYHSNLPPSDLLQRRSYLIPVAITIGCLPWLILLLVVLAAIIGGLAGGGVSGGNVALIRVTGAITAGKSSSGPFSSGVTGSEDLVSQLEKARKDRDIKAIVIRINSPGGSAAGSEEAWNEIMRIRKSGKPVYTSMGDVAASGGYYIASATDRIFADSSTVTGSIGVIYSGADMSDLYKKIGFRPEIIKSGKFKDIGSPARPLTPEEQALIQGIINSTFARFVQAVSIGRDMPEADVRKIADGRIFTGDQALKVKLIDQIGGLRETVLAAAKAGNVKGEPKVLEYQRRSLFGILGGDGDTESSLSKSISRELLKELVNQNDAYRRLR